MHHKPVRCYYKEDHFYIKKPQQTKRMEKESKRETGEPVSASFGIICNLCPASVISGAREIIKALMIAKDTFMTSPNIYTVRFQDEN